MAYQAIYRKWRPQVFEDIIGQSHITNTLKNQIMNERISHAYLFCGTRGTGKTTAAKVLSKAVNCKNPKNGSPCNECDICRGIQDGSILDITEIDAASNNGVENIREIREDVNFVATQTKYRVYIIDEVHMLSTSAFNALLKTLEEPPSHVIFVLATTEVHKIPETILSRCQRFDFKRITPSDIIVRMKEIATADGISITDDGYEILARLADGSMRDGLSILERCVSACGNQLNRENITDVLGMVESDLLFDLTSAIFNNNSESTLSYIDTVIKTGKDLNVFFDSLLKHLRDLLVCKVSDTPQNLLDCSSDILVKYRSQAEKCSYEKLSNAITLLTKAKADAKWVKNPQIIYELSLIKLTRPELDSSNEALLDRLSSVKEKAQNGIVIEKVVEEKKEEQKPKKKADSTPRLYLPIDKSTLTSSSPLVMLAKSWDKISSLISTKLPHISGFISNRKVAIDGEGLLLLFEDSENATRNICARHIDELQAAFKRYSNSDFTIKPVFKSDVEDVIFDFNNLPKSDSEPKNINIPNASDYDSSDPLDMLKLDFPDIVDVETDDNKNSDIPTQNHQENLLEIEDDKEEFLEDSEIDAITREELENNDNL